jgi:type IV pilus assembly protein PilO
MKLSDLNSLDFSNAGQWPPIVKAITSAIIMVAVAGAGYWFFTRAELETLDKARVSEQQLRQEFMEKQKVMANIDAYRAQIEEMQRLLKDMLRQLPTRTEMPDLLEDISNTGKRNGLNFELFKPEGEQPREFYAAKPISIKARASYHQFGAFVSNVAALSRIVTLDNASINTEPQKEGKTGLTKDENSLLMLIEATLQTYRYLDEDSEGSAQNKLQDQAMSVHNDQRKMSQ